MTTVTPSDSDRAGAASAKRPATIPTQRSGQALRLLVLGTGGGAVAFRARAAEAGAELAQRFSVRVTHVVAEDGIGEDDARVVRARAAGLPVLALAEATRLIEERAAGAAGDEEAKVEDGHGDTGAVVGGGDRRGESANARLGGGTSAEAGAEKRASAGAGAGGGARVGAGAGTRESSGAGVRGRVDDIDDVVAVIRPRTDVVPEPVDGGPSDVFTGSALEAMLQFPPLPAEEVETDAREMDALEGAVRVADGAGVAADEARSALMDVASETYAGAEIGAGVAAAGGREQASVGVGASGVGIGDGDGDGDEVGAEVEDQTSGDAVGRAGTIGAAAAREGERAGAWTASSIAWALVPLLSLGLLTPVAIGYAAYRLRSRGLAAATACYTFAIVAAFALSAVVPVRSSAYSVIGDLLTTCLAASWIGGTVHSFLIRRRVFG